MQNYKESNLIPRSFEQEYAILDRGEGIYLYDETGKRYIDGSSGSAAVTNLGNNVPEVIDAIIAQVRQHAYCPNHAFVNKPALELCELLATITPEGLTRTWLVSMSLR